VIAVGVAQDVELPLVGRHDHVGAREGEAAVGAHAAHDVGGRHRPLGQGQGHIGAGQQVIGIAGLAVGAADRHVLAVEREAHAIVRGIRAISDYEYELQMALMNRRLEPSIETVFMMPAEKYSYVSSRLVKEVFQLGGELNGLVPPLVEARMKEKVKG